MSTGLFLFVLLVVLVLANISLELIARWRNPPTGQFLDINGVRLHYVVAGDSPRPGSSDVAWQWNIAAGF